jgi:histone H3/H4
MGQLILSFSPLQILTKPRLQELVREIDPTEQLDEEVEEILLQIADDFVENTVNAACLLAKHRKNPKVEVRDVQLHLGELSTRNSSVKKSYLYHAFNTKTMFDSSRAKLEYVDTRLWHRRTPAL